MITTFIPQGLPFVFGSSANKCRDYSFRVTDGEGRGHILWIRADHSFHLYEIMRRIERNFEPAEILEVKIRGRGKGTWHSLIKN